MKHVFKWLGISESETDVYELISLNSPVTESDLREKAGVRAAELSKILRLLINKGVISKNRKREGVFYSAEPMRMLLAGLDATVNNKFITINKACANGSRERVRCFDDKPRGLMAIKDALRGRHKDGMVEITDVPSMFSVLSRADLFPLRRIIRKRRVGVNGIYFQKNNQHSKHAFLESARLPPEFKDFRSNIGVYGNNLVLVTFDKKMRTIIIKDKWLAKTFRTLFAFALHSVELLQRQPKA